MSDYVRPELCSIVSVIYDNLLVKINAEDSVKRTYDHFHPSEFGGCKRAIYLKSIGYGTKFHDPQKIRIFQAGHGHHDRMQAHFASKHAKLKLRGCWVCRRCGKTHGRDEKIGIYIPDNCDCFDSIPDNFNSKKWRRDNLFTYREITVRDEEYNFRGNVDAIVDIEGESGKDDRYVIDFKTMKSTRWSFLREPDPKYVVQLNIYMMCLGIDKGIIFYENKNDHSIKEFLVRTDSLMIGEIQRIAKVLQKMIDDKTRGSMPKVPASFEKNKFPCTWCDVSKTCWEMT